MQLILLSTHSSGSVTALQLRGAVLNITLKELQQAKAESGIISLYGVLITERIGYENRKIPEPVEA